MSQYITITGVIPPSFMMDAIVDTSTRRVIAFVPLGYSDSEDIAKALNNDTPVEATSPSYRRCP